MAGQGLRVLLLSPIGTKVNPYIGLLEGGLRAAGAEVRTSMQLAPADLVGGTRPDVIHLHWLERYALSPAWQPAGNRSATGILGRAVRRLANGAPANEARRWLRLRKLFTDLRAFQAAGGRVAYTLHNLDPHERGGPSDRWAQRRLVALADVVHVHDSGTAQAVRERFDRTRGVVIIPHGHYVDAYPNSVSRSTARASLGLPADGTVFASLGLMRPYKGLEELIAAFRELSEPAARLLIAGKAHDPTFQARLQALADSDDRIRLEPRFIAQDEVQCFYNAADACVLPYRQITTSGAALLALSFGVPVIAPAIGSFPFLIDETRGVLYDPEQDGALCAAMRRVTEQGLRGARSEIIAWVRQFDWAGIGAQLLSAYGQAGARRAAD